MNIECYEGLLMFVHITYTHAYMRYLRSELLIHDLARTTRQRTLYNIHDG